VKLVNPVFLLLVQLIILIVLMDWITIHPNVLLPLSVVVIIVALHVLLQVGVDGVKLVNPVLQLLAQLITLVVHMDWTG